MKKLASILISFALAVGLMVPAMAFADDGVGNVAIDYNGQRINLKPQVDENAHSLMISFQVETDDAKYQNFVSTGFTLSNEARSARIAQSNTSGSTVNAVISNGESALPFSNNTFFLGTLTVNVNAKLGANDSTAARIVVTQVDTTDETFGAPTMHAMTTRDDEGELISVESRSVPVTLAAAAFTGTTTPTGGEPGVRMMPSGEGTFKAASEVVVGDGQMTDGASVDTAALQALGSDILSKVKEQAANYPGLTDEQLEAIAKVIEAAGGDLSLIDVEVTPTAGVINPDEAKADIALLEKKITGANLLGVYDLKITVEMSYESTSTGPMEVTELTEPVNFTVKVPEGTLSTMNAAVGYVHNGEASTINEGVKPLVQQNAVEFPAKYFSTYAVYGKAKAALPTTGPVGSLIQSSAGGPALLIGFGALAVIGFAGAIITARKRRAQLRA